MANTYDINIVSVDLGAYSGANARPLVKLPDGFGGITVHEAQVIGNAAGTAVGLELVTLTDAGTPAVNGTVGSFAGTVVFAEGVPAACTISTAYVEKDLWLGVIQTSGTTPANTVLSLSYSMGK
jgi:microcystin-dependent protein